MQSLGARLYTLLAAIFFISSVVLRFGYILLDWSESVNIVFYVLSLLGIVFTALESLKHRGTAFDLKQRRHMCFPSYACALGFFVSFVQSCIDIHEYLAGEGYVATSVIVAHCIMCGFALVSCGYFIIVGISFSDSGYDFRRLRLMHLAPIIWSIGAMLGELGKVFSIKNSADEVLRCMALVSLLCFFYFFATEVEGTADIKKITVIFAGISSYICALLFFDRAINAIGNVTLDYYMGVAVTALMFSIFAYFFKRSIPTDSVFQNEG